MRRRGIVDEFAYNENKRSFPQCGHLRREWEDAFKRNLLVMVSKLCSQTVQA